MVKKVLIITYFFPPNPEIASARLGGLAKYLPEFGWDPTILTPRLPLPFDQSYKVVTTDPSDLLIEWKQKFGFSITKTIREQLGAKNKKDTLIDYLLNFLKEIIAYPDYCKGWHKKAIPIARHLLTNEKFDAIISSAGPYTAHIIAHDLKKEFNIPWIADFRDLWTQNPYYSHSSIRLFFETRLEEKTLHNADAITSVSEPLIKQLQSLHKTPIFIVPNGFDPDLLNNDSPVTKKFSINYTGRLYRDKRDPEPLFRVIKQLIDEESLDPNDIEIHFWGFFEKWVLDLIRIYKLEKIAQIHDKVSHERAIEKQRTSQILLLLSWNDPRDQGVLTGKLFEYFAAKRPILALGHPQGSIKDVLQKTGAGVIPSNEIELTEILKSYYGHYKKEGYVPYNGIEHELLQYSHREMSKKFAKILHIIDKSPNNTH